MLPQPFPKWVSAVQHWLRLACYWSCLSAGWAPAAHAQPTGGAPLPQPPASRTELVVGSYTGVVGSSYRIWLQLSTQDSAVTGHYYYARNGRLLRLTGHVAPSGELVLRESTNLDSATTGVFVGRRQPGGQLSGSWHNIAGTVHLPFQLTRVAGTAVPAVARARVSSKTYFHSFTLPLVSVPDAGVSKRLAAHFSLENILNETPVSLRAQLKEERESGMPSGAQDLSYHVAYNGHGLLSLTTLSEVRGANVWYEQQTHTLDLNTGFAVVLADELRPERVAAFLALGQQKLRKVTRAYVPTQQGFLQPYDVAGVLSQTFSLGSTDEYTVSATGLVFDHPVSYDGLSNFVFKVLTGNFQVAFSHAELARFLKPDSPLRRLTSRKP